MQSNRKSRAAREEETVERAILALVMAVYPHFRTIPELSREIGSREAVERATERLVEYGLVRLHGTTLIPTEPAFHCHRLDAW